MPFRSGLFEMRATLQEINDAFKTGNGDTTYVRKLFTSDEFLDTKLHGKMSRVEIRQSCEQSFDNSLIGQWLKNRNS